MHPLIQTAGVVMLALLPACTASQSSTGAAAPGLTQEEIMRRSADAAEPGEMHARLMTDVGRWKGTSRSWPSLGAEPMDVPTALTIRPILGGRFIETEFDAEIPGLGHYDGILITGYDNAAGEFQSTWVDSVGTTMMTGAGELSDDGRSIGIEFTYFCPVRMRRIGLWQVITRNSADQRTHRMWGLDIATGKEYLMMEAVYTRVADGGAAEEKR